MNCDCCGGYSEWPRYCQDCHGEMCWQCINDHECPAEQEPAWDDYDEDDPLGEEQK